MPDGRGRVFLVDSVLENTANGPEPAIEADLRELPRAR